MDISTGDFPVEQLSNAIIKSSMIDYACKIYMDQEKVQKVNHSHGSVLMLVVEETKRQVLKYDLKLS